MKNRSVSLADKRKRIIQQQKTLESIKNRAFEPAAAVLILLAIPGVSAAANVLFP